MGFYKGSGECDMIVQITDHIGEAKARLIQQYKDADNLKAILDSFNQQTQDLETVFYSLLEGRWVDNATGKTLDDFGTIVGQARSGFDDEFYRILLKLKMVENISQGETETVISAYKIVTRATEAFLDEHFPAGLILLSNGTINPVTAQFISTRLQKIVGAGIRVDQIGHYDDGAFGFLGAPNSGTFGDATDALVGGVFAYLYDISLPFSFFDSNDPDDKTGAGFGTLDDHILGGQFASL
jgi:hypothetical protein